MKHAISNIALSPFRHETELGHLQEVGLQGLEVAPSRVWEATWEGLSNSDVSTYRRAVENAGLRIIGLHSLLFDHRELELFGSVESRQDLLDYFVHLSAVCRDLGGKTLIWGGGRRRGNIGAQDAETRAIDFFNLLAERIDGHGTCYCIEPLGPADTDFVHSVFDSKRIVDAVGSSSLKIQIDAKALVANDELTISPFEAARANLVHYHANEPGFDVLGKSGTVDHVAAGQYLRAVGYEGYVSIEQKLIDPEDPLATIRASVAVLQEAYA